MNIREARVAAKQLKAAVNAGDPAAVARVLAAHPKYVGRPHERLNTQRLSLRDAQATIAAEHGFEDWEQLLCACGDAPTSRRWQPTDAMLYRTFNEARSRGDTYTMGDHVLLALLAPRQPTIAAAVLQELGHTHDSVLQALPPHRDRDRDTGDATVSVRSTPGQQFLTSFADGLALALGADERTDEHVLLALVYEEHRVSGSTLVNRGIDPDEVYEALARHGIPVPPIRPPRVSPAAGPQGPRVYVPRHEATPVSRALRERHPPGTLMWGTNRSNWKPGHVYFVSEHDIDLEGIARTAVANPDDVLVVPADEVNCPAFCIGSAACW